MPAGRRRTLEQGRAERRLTLQVGASLASGAALFPATGAAPRSSRLRWPSNTACCGDCTICSTIAGVSLSTLATMPTQVLRPRRLAMQSAGRRCRGRLPLAPSPVMAQRACRPGVTKVPFSPAGFEQAFHVQRYGNSGAFLGRRTDGQRQAVRRPRSAPKKSSSVANLPAGGVSQAIGS